MPIRQPMDQGVIQSPKAYYRKRIVCLCSKALYENKPLSKITTLQAIKNLLSYWTVASKRTIANSFKKALSVMRTRRLV